MLPESVKAEARASQAEATIKNALHEDLEAALEGRFGFISKDQLYLAAGVSKDKAHLRHNAKYSKAIDEVTERLGWKWIRLPPSYPERPRGYFRTGEKEQGLTRDGRYIILTHNVGAHELGEIGEPKQEVPPAPANYDYDAPFLD
jgi:hypothetical protein